MEAVDKVKVLCVQEQQQQSSSSSRRKQARKGASLRLYTWICPQSSA
jgi:hypothetical protein